MKSRGIVTRALQDVMAAMELHMDKARGTIGCIFFFFLIHRSHSISFTRAQGIPKYKIRFGREKDGKVGERLVEGGGGHGARDGGWREQPSLAVMLATGQFKNWG